jgi:hypothetical protein
LIEFLSVTWVTDKNYSEFIANIWGKDAKLLFLAPIS